MRSSKPRSRMPGMLRKILKALGLIPVFRYEKRRKVFRKGTLRFASMKRPQEFHRVRR